MLAACMLPMRAALAQAYTLTTLHTFSALTHGANTDGADPTSGALTQGADGSFYGTAGAGGSSDNGTVFKITSSGTLTTLVNFDGTDGSLPVATLLPDGVGNFYGATYQGGAGTGTVFKITPSGTLTTLYAFTGANDGAFAGERLALDTSGTVYGTAVGGGSGSSGTVFKITPTGMLTVLHSFSPLGNDGTNSDGSSPHSGLILGSDGDFYGTTDAGGAGGGTVFKITPTGAFTLLHSFSATHGSPNIGGALPDAALIQGTDGNFYGTTVDGGSFDGGTVFKITPAGALTTLVNFNGFDGHGPYAGLTQGSDGNFYGTTTFGGDFGSGTVFKMIPSGTVTTLYSFSAVNANNENGDGANPFARLTQGSDGDFYGVTNTGGSNGNGTVFKIIPPSPATLTGLSPASIQAGNLTFVLTVTGIGLSYGARVSWGSSPLVTTYISSTTLTAAVPASLVATQGPVPVTVTEPNVAPSNALAETITPGLTLTRISPASVPAGSGPISITVTGSNFVNGAVVKWNGQPLPTFYLSPTAATATVPASYLATARTAQITISNPHVYASAPLAFTVTP